MSGNAFPFPDGWVKGMGGGYQSPTLNPDDYYNEYLTEFQKQWNFDKYEYPDNPDSWKGKTIRYFAHYIIYSPLIKPKTYTYENEQYIELPYQLFELIKQIVIPILTELSKKYQKRTADKVIVLGNDTTEEIIKIPYYTRFSKNYDRMIKRKFKQNIEPILRNYNSFHFLTMTIDPKQHMSIGEAYNYLRKLVNKLMTRIRKRYPGIFYISTTELQKNGYPHIHILIAGIDWIPNEWIRLTEELKDPHINIIKQQYLHGYNYKGAMNYILKYITKGIKENEIDNTFNYIQKVIQWALFSRSYSTSRIPRILNLNTGMNNSNENLDQIVWYVLGIVNYDPEIEKISTKNDFLYYLYGPMT